MKTEDNSLPVVNEQFLAGDVRAAENPSLTALQVLFVREHNWQVDRSRRAPELERREPLPGSSRHRHGGTREHHLHRVPAEARRARAIDDYTGYNAKVDATISAEFAGAAFRFGHSIVSGDTERIDNDGNVAGPARDPAAGRVLHEAGRLQRLRRRRRLPAPPRRRSLADDGRAHRRGPAQLPVRPAGRHGPRGDQHPARTGHRARHAQRDAQGLGLRPYTRSSRSPTMPRRSRR